MRTLLFTIYDEKAQVFLPPFFVPTVGIAVRAFIDCIGPDSEHQFSKHPGDYTLFELGEFHDHDCSFNLIDKKSHGNGVEFLQTIRDLEPSDNVPTNPPIQPNEKG